MVMGKDRASIKDKMCEVVAPFLFFFLLLFLFVEVVVFLGARGWGSCEEVWGGKL